MRRTSRAWLVGALSACVVSCMPALAQHADRVVIPQGPSFGFGGSRPRINLLGRRTPITIPSVPAVVTPLRPVYPPVWSPSPPRCEPIPHPYTPRTYVEGSGLTIDGRHTGDTWDIGFHLGSPGVVREESRAPSTSGTSCPPTYVWPGAGVYWGLGARWYYGSRDLRARPVYDDAMSMTPAQPMTQAPAQPAAPEPKTDAEVGIAAMIAGDYPQAIAALRRHLSSNPDDPRAMRSLAVAMLADKRPDDAGSLMRAAYRADPTLAGEPLMPAALGFAERPFRLLVGRAVQHAHRVNTGSSWLLVASLMQGEGRRTPALTMIDRARAQGLDQGICDSLSTELRN
jgi:hypothetical protein